MSYHGYGRFIIFRNSDEGYSQFEILHSDVTSFGPTVPFRRKKMKMDLNNFRLTDLGEEDKLEQPHDWLSEYASEFLAYDIEDVLDSYGFELNVGEFAELTGFLEVVDTSSDTPDGREYDSELHFDDADFTKFKLEDLKESYYYDAWEVAAWLEYSEGYAEGETIETVYARLVAEGYNKTHEHLEAEQEEELRKYNENEMMGA